ncbi:MAG: hypothetical protein HY897_24565 [Deltaproteobacteria bacterium]|nr:hypothetical protein [Deltaproteobacteria bacterium]
MFPYIKGTTVTRFYKPISGLASARGRVLAAAKKIFPGRSVRTWAAPGRGIDDAQKVKRRQREPDDEERSRDRGENARKSLPRGQESSSVGSRRSRFFQISEANVTSEFPEKRIEYTSWKAMTYHAAAARPPPITYPRPQGESAPAENVNNKENDAKGTATTPTWKNPALVMRKSFL